MSRERNSGWESVRHRVRKTGRDRVGFHRDPRLTHAGNKEGQQQGYQRVN